MNQTGPTQRQLRVGEELRHIIAEVLQRGHFHDKALFDLAQNVTVTEVRVSPDLKHATAYVLTLGGGNMDEVLPALNESAFHFQHEINRKIKMKFTPKLRFVKDDSFEKADKIENILKKITYSE